MHLNLATAVDFFYRYGGVGRSEDDLRWSRPTIGQLEEAKRQAINFAERATILLARHHKIGEFDAQPIGD